jgi:beta-galactosidase/beta-glucuronidase
MNKLTLLQIMKKYILAAGVCLFSLVATSQQWKPAGDKIKTVWGEQLDPNNVLPEYPRPIMERAEWKNLNGLWDFTTAPVKQSSPASYDKKILVPFAVESSLSGIGQEVDDQQALWYSRTFTVPASWKNRHVLLHFGAVDWKTDVYLNDVRIGSHTGGYTPFCFDVTPFLKSGGEQKLTVRVWDPTDRYYQPRGKQVSKPDGIVYTPVSGIWQTVWLEPVNERHITSLKTLPNVDKSTVSITVNTANTAFGDYVEVRLRDGDATVSATKAVVGETFVVPVPDAKLWSPDTPFLYDLEITLYSNGKPADKVKSYCAMRKISCRRDSQGIMRLQLNNKDLYQFGPLDQGWFPDGLYTAPSDEALKYDIVKAKDFGFNMIRKHIKVEPARWYTHCDRIGMLVWQDMVSGDNNWAVQERSPFLDSDIERKPNPAQENYFKEWQEIIDALYSYPSIVMWIPFNEGWGQFRTKDVAEWTAKYDPSRILNIATGGHFYHLSDVLDMHNYPEPRLVIYDAARVNLLGEYGGIPYAVEGHLWRPDKNFGYETLLTSPKTTTDRYIEYLNILKAIPQFSGAVYTQITDVEGEVNGLVTYDRKVIKVEEERIRQANQELIRSLDKK